MNHGGGLDTSPPAFSGLGMGNGMGTPVMNMSGGGPFSWLDLGATWSFATQNNSASGSAGGEEDILGGDGLNPFEMDVLTDYRLLNDDNPNWMF